MANPWCQERISSLSESLIIAQPCVLKFKFTLFCNANDRKTPIKLTYLSRNASNVISNRRLMSGCDAVQKKNPSTCSQRTGSQSAACERRLSRCKCGKRGRRGFWSTTCSFTTACLSAGVSRQLRAVSRGVGVERTKRTLEASCQPEDRWWRPTLIPERKWNGGEDRPFFFLYINLFTGWTNYRYFSPIKTSVRLQTTVLQSFSEENSRWV